VTVAVTLTLTVSFSVSLTVPLAVAVAMSVAVYLAVAVAMSVAVYLAVAVAVFVAVLISVKRSPCVSGADRVGSGCSAQPGDGEGASRTSAQRTSCA